jgi:hypothetical protein
MRETVHVCGDYLDGDIYPVFQPAGKRRSKCNPTSYIQLLLNQRNAERKLIRLVHTNFNQEDIVLHLTYRDGSVPVPDEAKRKLQNFLNRVKRLRKRLGLEPLKYISCTEISKRSGRVHHHVIMSGGVDRDMLEQLWGKGYANSKRLQFGDDGVTGLAKYMTKDKHFYKRWNQSRNLIKPEPIIREITHARAASAIREIEYKRGHSYFEKIWPGWELTTADVISNPYNRGDYIRYEMRRRL